MADQDDLNVSAIADDAKRALNEVYNAGVMTDEVLNDGESSQGSEKPADAAGMKEVTEGDVNLLRKRALQQRERGKKNLARRHDGIASVVQKVSLNERVVGSAFERFFPVIENGIYVIMRRGDMFFTERNLGAVVEILTKMITDLAEDLDKETSALAQRLEEAKVNSGALFVTPGYTAPAATHEVQIRTRLGVQVLHLFQKNDHVISGLQTLFWNGEVEQDAIDEQELRLKRKVRDLAKYIGRTLRSMRNKVAATEPATDEAQAQSSPAALEAA